MKGGTFADGRRSTPSPRSCFAVLCTQRARGSDFTDASRRVVLLTSSCPGTESLSSSMATTGTPVRPTAGRHRSRGRTLSFGNRRCVETGSGTHDRPRWRRSRVGLWFAYGNAQFALTQAAQHERFSMGSHLVLQLPRAEKVYPLATRWPQMSHTVAHSRQWWRGRDAAFTPADRLDRTRATSS